MKSNSIYAQIGHQTISTARDREQAKKIPEQKLEKAIKASNQVLISTSTVFPLTLFPDTMTIDRAKLTITRRQFFQSSEIMSIRLEDILNVTATTGPFFGSLKITSRVMNNEKPFVVSNFWRDDALRLKRILQGYVIAVQKKIDCSALSSNELREMLDRLGEDDHD
jgi:hypothetical protein